jgi:hypothetical protein
MTLTLAKAFCRTAGSSLALALLATAAPLAAAPSTNATVNLIQLLIKNKVITKAAGEALLAQAEAEAAQARAEIATAGGGVPAAAAAAPVAVAAAGELAAPPPGTIRVPYIPESVKAKIKDDIKKEVLAQAQSEGWAQANQIPAWIKGVTLYGDMRFRNESVFYSDNNADELIDFELFNARSPIDINANTNPTGFPILNTRTNRPSRFRIRARLGLKAELSETTMLAFRLASGDDRSPISTNQILGGGLAKKDVWIDQAYLRVTPTNWLTATFGRFANPFQPGSKLFDTAELLFDNDLNFDGVAVSASADQWLPEDTRLALTVGAFPLGYASNDFPDNALVKAGDGASKWLFSAQLRGGATFGDGAFDINGTLAYHSFKGVQGQLSQPCALFNGNTQCSTDQYRPDFLRKGNTLFFLRDIATDPASPNNFAQPQLLGLSFDYDVLEASISAGAPVSEGIDILVTGEYVRNLAYKRQDICRNDPKGLPINNITVADPVAGAAPGTPGANFYTNPCRPDAQGRIARFDGGNQGFLIRGVIGKASPKKFGEWNVELSYRYLESDAVLDSLADSDFHRGGTNAKGYSIGGALGLSRNLVLTGRWLSANQISGPPLAIDVLQIDLLASF